RVLSRRQSCHRRTRPSHGRNRPSERLAISTLVMTAVRSRMPAISFAFVVTAMFSGAIYFVFGDDVLARLSARQAETKMTYEDHVAELRARVDRIVIAQFLDQKQIE